MSDHHHDQPFPPGVLYAAGGLIVLTMILALAGRLTGFGTVTMPDAEPLQQVEVRFEDRSDGGIVVYEADGQELSRFEPGTNGFLRGVLRGFTRERQLEKIGDEAPFVLTLYETGRLAISDPTTGQKVELNAFGRDNAEPFARLLVAAGE